MGDHDERGRASKHPGVLHWAPTALVIVLLTLSLIPQLGCGGSIYSVISPTAPTSLQPVAAQSGSVQLTPQYAALSSGEETQFHAAINGPGSVEWLVNGIVGGNTLSGTIDSGHYVAPAGFKAAQNVVVTAALVDTPTINYATAVVSLLRPGQVSGTANPQVADYTFDLPVPGKVFVEFGETQAYGRTTSVQATPSRYGSNVSSLVAGMRGKTLYHMRAQVVLNDGATFRDEDQTFMTGQPPLSAVVEVTNPTAGGTPQPGIEMFDTLRPHEAAQAFATDLSGNVIWTYTYKGSLDDAIQPIKMLPNGHFLVQIAYPSSIPVMKGGAIIPGTLDELREVDLAGATVRSLTQTQIAQSLANQGYPLQLGSLHHDVLSLPNGHLLLLFSASKVFADLVGYPGQTSVLGDVLVDVDQNFIPDWVWNSFEHLDVNRHPYLFPDWTHANALLYSADDHNVLLSVRHQDWILKIDFEDGKGSGNVLWRLGVGGDFQLKGATDPTDWFYAQHGPSFFSSNTAGTFELGIMDNGDDREFPPGVLCGLGGAPPCLYSTATVMQVDEREKIVTVKDRYSPQGTIYSFFGGNVDSLANGDLEVNFCAADGGSLIQELGGANAQQVVWQAITKGTNQYRAERLPSLYPGVQW